MSFVRVGGRNPPRKRKAAKKKPWDDTVNDLDAYKATPEEIEYRKATHRSKHAVTTHIARPGSARKGKRASPFKNSAQARKIAIMKEVLYDQQQLQDVLERSDTMMAVVKDLFGDDPRRFAGIPSVTTAPNVKKADLASSLINLPPELRTRSEELSDSVMNQSALNEFAQSDSDIDESGPALLSYQPKINMQRFQQFIENEEKNTTLSTISGQAGLSHLGQTLASQLENRNVQSSQLPDQTAAASKDGSFQTPPKNKADLDESLEILKPPKSAMNDTGKINKTKRRVPKPVPEHNTSNLSLNELRKVLETLENEVAEYERQTGRRPPAERQRQETFSGYTLAIVDSVTKLTRYLRECEMRLNAEMIVREQLAQDVIQFRALVDALTSDIILTQEEFHQMSTEFQRFRQETYTEIQRLKGQQSQQWSPSQSLTSNPVVTSDPTSSVNPAEPVMTQTPPKAEHYHPVTQGSGYPGTAAQMFGEHLKPLPAAVMLSPPVRRSRVLEPERDVTNRQQGSLLDVQDYISTVDSSNSGLHEDFADLPGHCVTSLAQVLNPYSDPQRSQLGPAVQGPNRESQPQRRAQATVAVNSVNVPRPTPLVQSNLDIPLSVGPSGIPFRNSQLPQSFSDNRQRISVKLQDRPQTLQMSHDQRAVTSHEQLHDSDLSHDSQSTGSDKEFLATQIADLNKQHAEAQRRLSSLLQQQQAAQKVPNGTSTLQQHGSVQQQQGPVQNQVQQNVITQNQGSLQQRIIQQQQQQIVGSVPRLMQSQVPPNQLQSQLARQQVLDNQQRLQQQQLQHEQQQRLLELVLQQQQRIQEQQRQQQGQLPKPNIPQEVNGASEVMRQSVEIPGYNPKAKQPGLPAYPVSPNISPISQRSEAFRNVYQSLDLQNASVSVPAGRGITVSIPTVDMDQSDDSPSPNPQLTARA